jgi:hypothetical protein
MELNDLIYLAAISLYAKVSRDEIYRLTEKVAFEQCIAEAHRLWLIACDQARKDKY